MPELPEVETVRRGLAEVLVGRRLARVEFRRPDLRIPFPRGFAAHLQGKRVEVLGRRAKYLLAGLEDGSHLIMHLGMSGRFTILKPRAERTFGVVKSGYGAHDHVVFETDEGTRLVFTDHRRFGLMTLAGPGALEDHPLLAGLGPEPLEEGFSGRYLAGALAGRGTSLKAALLDQRLVAGLGNIYVCEALFRARLSPRRMAARVGAARAERLVAAVKAVLEEAIAAGGSSLRDYARTDGELGLFQHTFRVYGREGERCVTPGCSGTVRRLAQGGRSSFYCPGCQR